MRPHHHAVAGAYGRVYERVPIISSGRKAALGNIARVGDGSQGVLQGTWRRAEQSKLALGFCHGGSFQRHQLKQGGLYFVGQHQCLGRMLRSNGVNARFDSTVGEGPFFAFGHLLRRGFA
jgi:hypothetical protein